MSNLDSDMKNLKETYRELFLKFADEINKCVYDVKPKSLKGEIFDQYPKDSEGRAWQVAVLNLVKDGIAPDVYKKIVEIKEYRKDKKFGCRKCGICCKFAVSEFSTEELKQKAENGDKYASQFLNIFVPYDKIEDAQAIYPEYVEFVKNSTEENVYFYHCLKINKNNLCSDYENRPEICKDFPDNPIAFLPKDCGFSAWKNEVEKNSLKLHAMAEITSFYKTKLDKILNGYKD